jgi:uncharacterized short protein YbdD (DUF466 family)
MKFPKAWIQLFFKRLIETGRLMVGVPDYDVYVKHWQEKHPGQACPTYEAFFRERQEKRYSSGAGKCC